MGAWCRMSSSTAAFLIDEYANARYQLAQLRRQEEKRSDQDIKEAHATRHDTLQRNAAAVRRETERLLHDVEEAELARKETLARNAAAERARRARGPLDSPKTRPSATSPTTDAEDASLPSIKPADAARALDKLRRKAEQKELELAAMQTTADQLTIALAAGSTSQAQLAQLSEAQRQTAEMAVVLEQEVRRPPLLVASASVASLTSALVRTSARSCARAWCSRARRSSSTGRCYGTRARRRRRRCSSSSTTRRPRDRPW